MSSTAVRLVVLPVSPWSERARWALDHHRIAYKTITHIPFLGERRLQRWVGPGKGRATVPVLLAGTERYTESWDIVGFADRTGTGTKLIPPGREDEVRAWNDRADRTMNSARALVVAGMLASDGALDESRPPALPRALAPVLRPITRFAMRWFGRKYGVDAGDTATPRARLRETLGALREALGGRPYLLGSFCYADVVMATCLQGVSPVANRYIPLGRATREVWTQPELAREFADLVAWRDRLYEAERG